MSQYGYTPTATRPTNGMAIAALVTGILGFAIIPVVLGHLALGQIKRTGDGGQALAVVGLILGYLACLGYVILVIMLIGGGVVLWQTS